MWDARLEAIRDRKLNEMVIFSALIRTDMPKRKEYFDIIAKLNVDLDLIEAMADNQPIPDTSPITSELYRSRLSKLEQLDEYCLDACRTGENDFGPIICKEHMSTSVAVKQDASVAVKQKAEAPAVIPEYPKPVQVEEKKESEIKMPEADEPERPAEIPIHAIKQDMPEVIPPEEPQEIEKEEPVEEVSAEEPVASEPESVPEDTPIETQEGEGEGIYDLVVSIDDAVALKRVREMKDGKVDLFIDRELNGHFNDDACEDVITFLKTDMKLIDLILSINVTSKQDIENKVKEIVDFVEAADEPKHQNLYINALNEEERKLEGQYNEVLKRLEGVITARYTYVLGDDKSSLFFH